jgi:hypothetical protein
MDYTNDLGSALGQRKHCYDINSLYLSVIITLPAKKVIVPM